MTQSLTSTFIELENRFGAHNYAPLPVVLTKGEGIYLWDVEGKRYIDMMSAYSAVSHGHCHPRLVAALTEQATRLAVCSRAFHSDKLGLFLKTICELTGFNKGLAMNTGAEAVETALKAARKWAYTVKGVPVDEAEIIACEGNFHGRTIAIVGMSSEPQYRAGFGPFPAGSRLVPYGDPAALARAITPKTAAFLVEPIQGEGGIIVPPAGYLQEVAQICRDNNVLLICDEIQTGLARTGRLLACQHDNVKPDAVVLGKALGGGLLPVSLFLTNNEVMSVFTPGDHGSTFGGSPLAAAVAYEALKVLTEEDFVGRAERLGSQFMRRLQAIDSPLIKTVRGKGLLIGVELDRNRVMAHDFCLKLLERGVLSKETHETVVRLAPPLIIDEAALDTVYNAIVATLQDFN